MDYTPNEFLSNLINFMALEATGYENVFTTICCLLIKSDRVNRIEAVVKDIEDNYDHYKSSNLIIISLENVIQYYVSKISQLPSFSWKMPYSVVCNQPDSCEVYLMGSPLRQLKHWYKNLV